MLRVTIEIVPFGQEDHPRKREIGRLEIGLQRVNRETNHGMYVSTMTTDGKHDPPNPVVQIFDHDRAEGAFLLVQRAIEAHLDPEDPGAVHMEADALLAALAAQNAPLDDSQPEVAVTRYCAQCDNIDPQHVTGIEYPHDSPNHYDGVSEWLCGLCGARTGRWSGRILQEGEAERPFGR